MRVELTYVRLLYRRPYSAIQCDFQLADSRCVKLCNNNNNKLCAWRHNMPPPLQVDNIFASSHLFARWHLFRHVGYLRHQQHLESGVRVTCDVGYLRQTDIRRLTDVRQKHRLMPRLLGAGHNNLIIRRDQRATATPDSNLSRSQVKFVCVSELTKYVMATVTNSQYYPLAYSPAIGHCISRRINSNLGIES